MKGESVKTVRKSNLISLDDKFTGVSFQLLVVKVTDTTLVRTILQYDSVLVSDSPVCAGGYGLYGSCLQVERRGVNKICRVLYLRASM